MCNISKERIKLISNLLDVIVTIHINRKLDIKLFSTPCYLSAQCGKTRNKYGTLIQSRRKNWEWISIIFTQSNELTILYRFTLCSLEIEIAENFHWKIFCQIKSLVKMLLSRNFFKRIIFVIFNCHSTVWKLREFSLTHFWQNCSNGFTK